MNSNCYDVIVIGGGPGGYKCAIRAAQLSLKVACIDKNQILGGTCLRQGCIPSKFLLHHTDKTLGLFNLHLSGGDSLEKIFSLNDLQKIKALSEEIRPDLSIVMKSKEQEQKILGQGIDFLFQKYGVKKFIGTGEILSLKDKIFTILVKSSVNTEEIKTRNIVIATGSQVASLPNIVIDEEKIVSSTQALSFDSIPDTLVIVGAGAIGLEMASVWSRLGAKVIVVEFLDRIAPAMDKEISSALLNFLKKQKINFMLSSKVTEVEKKDNMVNVTIESHNQQQATISADKLLIAVGRKPFTEGLTNLDLELDKKGFIKLHNPSLFDTNIKGIFAIGDVVGGQMLAHKAEAEGIAVAEIISGQRTQVDYDVLPSIIYTHPVVASIGKTEEQLKEEISNNTLDGYKVGKSNFSANSRSRIMGDTQGFVKILCCKKTDTILGIHIIGAYADMLINEASVAMHYGSSSEDLFRICHSHPDVNEAVRDAAEAAFLKH